MANEFDELVNAQDLANMAGWESDIELKKMFNQAEKPRSNREVFSEELNRIGGCDLYNPCPICFKCKNKASHLHVKCQICKIPICVHTYEETCRLIRRENFTVNVEKNYKEKIKEQAKTILKKKD